MKKNPNCEVVIQEEYGFSGVGTYILSKENYVEKIKNLPKTAKYAKQIL